MSIRLKLTIMFLAIATMPLLFVSALTFTNYKKSLEASRLSQLKDIAAYKADKIETYFAGVKSNIEIAQGLYNIKKNFPVLLRFSDDPNNPDLLASKEMLDTQLSQMQSVLTDVSDIMLVNPQGRVVYTNKSRHYNKDLSKAPTEAEQQAFMAGKYKICFSDIYFDKAEDNRYEMLVTAPAFDFNNFPIGVIAFEVDMTTIYKFVQDATGLGDTGETLIGKKIGNQVLMLNPLRHDPNAALNRRANIGDKTSVGIQNAVQGTGAGQYIDYRGEKVVGAWRRIPSMDWGMVAKIDADEAFADVTNLRNLAAVILVIIIVLSSITAFSIAHSISEPIKRLSEGAAIIGSGNLDYKIGTSHKDEIGQLSRSFDKMTLDLKQTTASRDELNREIVERKKAEETLRLEQERLDLALKSASMGVWRWEIIEDKRYFDDQTCHLLGIDASTFTGAAEEFFRVVNPEYREKLKMSLTRTIEQNAPYESEYMVTWPDGSVHYLTARGKLTRDDAGRPVRINGIIWDITERRRAEEALRESGERLGQAMAVGELGSWGLDTKSGKAWRSLRHDQIFGYPELLPEWTYKMFLDHVLPEDRNGVDEKFGQALAKGEDWNFECRIRRSDGEIRWIWAQGKPRFNDRKEVVQLFGLVQDITERKEKEEELRKLNRTLRALSDSSQAMMNAKDESQYLQEVCDIIVKDCGHAMVWVGFAENDEGKTVRPVANAGFEQGYLETLNITWADTERGRGPTGTAIRTGRMSMCRNMLTDPAFGPWRGEALKRGYASSIVLPLISDGKAFGSLTIYSREPATFSDDEVGLLTELADDLAHGIAAIRLHIARDEAEQALRKAHDELARSNKDLEQFAYVASHDLQEPLRAVSGFVELLRRNLEKSLDAKTNEYINFTIDGAKRMQALINGLLEYSRIGTQGKIPSKTDSKAALDEAIARLQTSVKETGAEITADGLPTVYFDGVQLSQLFQNLIGNAIKFRGEHAPRINISAVRKDDGWQFDVTDNGIGIEPQYAERIFQIFQRLHSREKYPGTGIGLSICKKIVERHNGKIWVEPKPGGGSTFYFTVPDKEGA